MASRWPWRPRWLCTLACPEVRLSRPACPGFVCAGLKLSLWRFKALPVPPFPETGDQGGFTPGGNSAHFSFLASNGSDLQAAEKLGFRIRTSFEIKGPFRGWVPKNGLFPQPLKPRTSGRHEGAGGGSRYSCSGCKPVTGGKNFEKRLESSSKQF